MALQPQLTSESPAQVPYFDIDWLPPAESYNEEPVSEPAVSADPVLGPQLYIDGNDVQLVESTKKESNEEPNVLFEETVLLEPSSESNDKKTLPAAEEEHPQAGPREDRLEV